DGAADTRRPQHAVSATAMGTERESAADPLLADLVETLDSERQRLAELRAALAAQRDAIAADDVAQIDHSVFTAQRVLLTLQQARAHRRALGERLGCGEAQSPRELIDALGRQASPALRLVVSALEDEARALAHESAINREVLRRQLAATDTQVRLL